MLCKLVIGSIVLVLYFVALGLAPILTMKVETVKFDDIKEWGFSGPSKDLMPETLKGVYYFDGNQAPKECDGPESNMCRCKVPGGQCYERSPLMLMDYSFCKYGERAVFGGKTVTEAFEMASKVVPNPELLWNMEGSNYPVYCSYAEGIMGAGSAGEGAWEAPGGKYVKILAALRAGYEVECDDETCKKASLYLSLVGMRLNKFMKYKGARGR